MRQHIDTIARKPPRKPVKPERWVTLADTFSRLSKTDQTRFFEAHRKRIEAWVAEDDA
ncbi:hypothetical protein [Breoghania sp. JC706]|uniref:hypothetical protein n=1 Tax=Breoghania sp. JC706 TaxID=3117732 RepID=UPI0030094AB2